MKYRVVVFGPPGTSADEVGSEVAAHFGLPHYTLLSLVSLAIARGSAAASPLIAATSSAPDTQSPPDQAIEDAVENIVREALKHAAPSYSRYVVSGYPLSPRQAMHFTAWPSWLRPTHCISLRSRPSNMMMQATAAELNAPLPTPSHALTLTERQSRIAQRQAACARIEGLMSRRVYAVDVTGGVMGAVEDAIEFLELRPPSKAQPHEGVVTEEHSDTQAQAPVGEANQSEGDQRGQDRSQAEGTGMQSMRSGAGGAGYGSAPFRSGGVVFSVDDPRLVSRSGGRGLRSERSGGEANVHAGGLEVGGARTLVYGTTPPPQPAGGADRLLHHPTHAAHRALDEDEREDMRTVMTKRVSSGATISVTTEEPKLWRLR